MMALPAILALGQLPLSLSLLSAHPSLLALAGAEGRQRQEDYKLNIILSYPESLRFSWAR